MQLSKNQWLNTPYIRRASKVRNVYTVEITNSMHKFVPLRYSYMLAPTCFGSSLPSSGSFWIRLSYMKIQIDMVVYHIMWLSGLCVGVSWFSLLCFLAECTRCYCKNFFAIKTKCITNTLVTKSFSLL
jgi:hypothetical protein